MKIGMLLGLFAFTALSAVAGGKDEPAKTVPYEVEIKSSLDGSMQPIRFFVPEKAKGHKAPLLVALHTWSNDQRSEWPWNGALDTCALRGWVLVYPRFRGPNWTPQACGSDLAVQDVLDAVEYAKAHADIDEDRIYLGGGSGGGHMSLILAGRHPDVWAGVFAACPITDVARWHADSVRLKTVYADYLVRCCGGTPAEKPDEYRHRSPLTWLAAARKAGVHVQIVTGVHDGRPEKGGLVPIGHAIRAYNLLADPDAAISEADVAYLEANAKAPEVLRFEGSDPFYGPDLRIHVRRTSGNVRLTLFEGGHASNFAAGIDWLSRQRRGKPVDWTLPETAKGGASHVSN